MGPFASIFGFAVTFLQLVLLFFIARGPWKRYFPLFLYILSLVMVSSAEGYVAQKWGLDREHYFPVYWGGELLLDVQLFLLIPTLTSRAFEGNALRSKVTRLMVSASVVVLLLPFVLFETQMFTTRWNDSTSQLLNFGAAVMNLGLWGALLISKNRDRQLLTVSAGLGVAVAGAALAHGLRRFTGEDTVARGAADFAYRFLQIGSVLIWCWAFWPRRKAPAVERSV